MASSWHEYYQYYLNCSDSERRKIATEKSNAVINYVRQSLSESDTLVFVIGVIGVFVSADGKVNNEEYAFFCDFTGINNISYDEFFEMTKGGYARSQVEALVDIAKGMPKDIRQAIVQLGTCICASNGTISVKEQEVIEEIWG